MGRYALTKEIRTKQLEGIGCDFRWDYSNFIVDNIIRIAPIKDRWCKLGQEQTWYNFGNKTLNEIIKREKNMGINTLTEEFEDELENIKNIMYSLKNELELFKNEDKEIWKAIREIRQHLQEEYDSDVDDFEVIIPWDIDEGGFKLP